MNTKALNLAAGSRIHRSISRDSCEVEALMRAAATCWRLPIANIPQQIRKLPARDRSDVAPEFVRKRLRRRIRALESLAAEGSPTSAVGIAYQVLLVSNMLALDDLIADVLAVPTRIGAADRLRDAISNAQNTAISAYHALRTIVKDPDLDVVEVPHDLGNWKPNRTVSALLARRNTDEA